MKKKKTNGLNICCEVWNFRPFSRANSWKYDKVFTWPYFQVAIKISNLKWLIIAIAHTNAICMSLFVFQPYWLLLLYIVLFNVKTLCWMWCSHDVCKWPIFFLFWNSFEILLSVDGKLGLRSLQSHDYSMIMAKDMRYNNRWRCWMLCVLRLLFFTVFDRFTFSDTWTHRSDKPWIWRTQTCSRV